MTVRVRLRAAGGPGTRFAMGLLIAIAISGLLFMIFAKSKFTANKAQQEETSALGIPCFTLRDSTERPVTVEHGTNTLLGLEPERLDSIPRHLETPRPLQPLPLWDGRAGERAATVLASFLETTASRARAVI